MNLHSRFVVVFFAALFVLAQQEAAVHAIGHLPELLAGAEHTHDDEDAAPHKCPDCARFAAIVVGAAAHDGPALQPAEGHPALVRPVLAAIASSPLARPRNRSPPRS